jgi:methionyl-tRNA formyltransferase
VKSAAWTSPRPRVVCSCGAADMRVVFLGTPDVAVPSLQALLEADDVEVVAVVTNPDRPRGRSRTPQPPPVKVVAQDAGIAVWQPERARDMLDDLRALAPDACAVVAYGALLPADVLAAGGAGFVNLHFSLLPRWRGAAPVQHAIRAGDAVTGITTFVLDQGMDTGPLLRQVEVAIQPEETAGELLDRLAVMGAPVLVDSLRDLVGGATPRPQPADGVTLAPKITPDDVVIQFDRPAAHVAALVRSASPAPGAHTTLDGERFKVHRARTVDGPDGEPGQIVALDREGPIVACSDGHVLFTEVQPAGRARMDGAAWVNGHRPEVGTRFGT